MEKWQLAGIISNDSKSEIILPIRGQRKPTSKVKRPAGNVSKFVQTTLRRMTEVIALF